jgi:hypothetical protein
MSDIKHKWACVWSVNGNTPCVLFVRRSLVWGTIVHSLRNTINVPRFYIVVFIWHSLQFDKYIFVFYLK